MKITYLGHSCFKLESQGYSIILDPYTEGSVPGYKPVQETADQALCSHGHKDHGAVECVTLRQGTASPFAVETIHTWHDDQQGALRGEDTIHILDDGQCRVAHLGDLGCELTPEQKDKLRGLTALLIPVGGYYTIDAAQASALADELAPAVVIPMHYRGEGFGYDVIGPLEDFTALRSGVREHPGSVLELAPETPRQTAVLKPENI
ncbi:MAG: MBL fold metallo-hydrolase [Lawsonibacter sp.]|nr:MBL fold metallo-hydrolase [Lawsonibacter sp.]